MVGFPAGPAGELDWGMRVSQSRFFGSAEHLEVHARFSKFTRTGDSADLASQVEYQTRQFRKGTPMIMRLLAISALSFLLAACGGGSGSPVAEALTSAPQASNLRAPPIAPPEAAGVPARPLRAAPPYAKVEAFFNWAQTRYPEYFGTAWENGSIDGFTYRYYKGLGSYLAVRDDGGIWVLGEFTDDEITYIAVLSAFDCEVYPDCGRGDPVDTGPNVTSGDIHNLLISWRSESQHGATETWQHNTTTGATGTLLYKPGAACSYDIDAQGNISYTEGGSTTRYTYEDNYGATNTTGYLRARLYRYGNNNGVGSTSSYAEVVQGRGLRLVHSGNDVEYWCVTVASDWSLRFVPDGILSTSYSGTWTGTMPFPPSLRDSNVRMPPELKTGATCSATILPAGGVKVVIAGYELPLFYLRDTHMSQGIMSTMYTHNPITQPELTYALRWPTSGWSGWSDGYGAYVATFFVYAAPLKYWDIADPIFDSPAMVTCGPTTKG